MNIYCFAFTFTVMQKIPEKRVTPWSDSHWWAETELKKIFDWVLDDLWFTWSEGFTINKDSLSSMTRVNQVVVDFFCHRINKNETDDIFLISTWYEDKSAHGRCVSLIRLMHSSCQGKIWYWLQRVDMMIWLEHFQCQDKWPKWESLWVNNVSLDVFFA